jgi:hypothetical protein
MSRNARRADSFWESIVQLEVRTTARPPGLVRAKDFRMA